MAKEENKEYCEEAGQFNDLYEIINYFLKLRLPDTEPCSQLQERINKKGLQFCDTGGKSEDENSFWSFRGQRDYKWDLEIMPRPLVDPYLKKSVDYKKLFKQFRLRMMEFHENEQEINYLDEDKTWRWLYYAKHHGLYTRLLDWSSNPLVAIYFAVENILSQATDDTIGAVWALKVHRDNFCSSNELPFKCENLDPASGIGRDEDDWLMINPEPVTRRLARQSGKFTYHPGKEPIAINKLKRRRDERLIKIVINPAYNELIRQQLGVMNIHHASLLADAEGVAQFVNQEWPEIGKY